MEAVAATFKLVVLGEGEYSIVQFVYVYYLIARVGKTSISMRFAHGNFDQK